LKQVIVVTEKEFEKGRDVYSAAEGIVCETSPREEDALAAKVRETGAKAVIVGVERYVGPLYEAIEGGIIARFGVGCDGIDRDLCKKHNIILTNTPGALDRSVAELATWLMGAVARKVAEGDRVVRGGEFALPAGEEMGGKTLLLAGFGRIARMVARIAGAGLGMKVLAFDILTLAEQAAMSSTAEKSFQEQFSLAGYTCDLEMALPLADVISIHMPSNESTYHYFDARRLAMCKQGAVLINTARGPIVDEVALYDALKSGKLSGAALDVFENEPYAPIDPARDLRTLPNVVLTPHIGSNTRQSNRNMAEMSLANCQEFLGGNSERIKGVNS
jgi:lactate dehydrogenase-like 2-hydroxyacid dehydrogenase